MQVKNKDWIINLCAKSNLFKPGDEVITEYGNGVVVRNCHNFRFWEVKIKDGGTYEIPFTRLELTFTKEAESYKNCEFYKKAIEQKDCNSATIGVECENCPKLKIW